LLDSQKFSVARGIHDEEKMLESLESRHRELVADLADLKAMEAAEDEVPPDAAAYVFVLYLLFNFCFAQLVRCF
jgi:hypothetical protein